MLVGFHQDSRTLHYNLFLPKPELLFQCRFARQQDAPTGPDNTVPRNIGPAVAQRPHYPTRRAWEAGGTCHISVGSNPAARDFSNSCTNFSEHYLLPVISFSLAKNAFFRSVSIPQFTGGD